MGKVWGPGLLEPEEEGFVGIQNNGPIFYFHFQQGMMELSLRMGTKRRADFRRMW